MPDLSWMVTQGQGLSKKDFTRLPEGARQAAEKHEPEALRAAFAHISPQPPRPTSLLRGGIERVHENAVDTFALLTTN